MNKSKKTIVFGIGDDFHEFADEILSNNNVCALMDNDAGKQGTMFRALRVHAPDELGKNAYDDILITSSAYCGAIRKQIEELGVPAEKIRTFALMEAHINKALGGIAGKTVLDIGCGAGNEVKALAAQFMPRRIVGIDISVHESTEGVNWALSHGDAANLDFADESFDAIYSRGAFEHIRDIKKTLAEVKRVLKKGGVFYCTFGAIWTSIQGWHDNGDAKLIEAMPPWCHLYMTDAELARQFAQNGFDDIGWMDYIKNHLNHYSRTELVNFIMFSGMRVKRYTENTMFRKSVTAAFDSELTDDICQKIVKAGYRARDLGICSMDFTLEKMD